MTSNLYYCQPILVIILHKYDKYIVCSNDFEFKFFICLLHNFSLTNILKYNHHSVELKDYIRPMWQNNYDRWSFVMINDPPPNMFLTTRFHFSQQSLAHQISLNFMFIVSICWISLCARHWWVNTYSSKKKQYTNTC